MTIQGTYNHHLGRRLCSLRRDRQLSQRALAERIGVSFSYLSKIEQGHRTPPSQTVILKIASALDVDPRELLNLASKVPSDLHNALKDNPLAIELLRLLVTRPLSDETYRQMIALTQESEARV